MSGLAQFRHDLNAWFTSLGAGTVGPEFYDLIKNIGEAKSKAVRQPIPSSLIIQENIIHQPDTIKFK